MELDEKALQVQLDALKKAFDDAGDTMKKSLKKDIEEVEKKIADSQTPIQKELEETKKELGEEKEKLAKVIKAQDDMLAGIGLGKHNGELPSFGSLLSEAMEENAGKLADFASKKIKSVQFQLKAVADMGFTGAFGTASQSVSTVRPGIIESAKRRFHVREILPQGSMDGSTFYYVKENGTGEGNPATVAENAFKEQIDLDLIEASAPAEYIAGWLRISKKMLADVKGMTSFLQSRLMEKLLRAEDVQLLSGSGVSPNLKGLSHTDNHTPFTGGATVDIEQLVQAISQLEDANEEIATGILVRPRQLYSMALNKAAGSGEYDLPSITTVDSRGQFRILGRPVYASTAVESDKFFVGDFDLGAMLITREPAVVEFFYEDGTNVRENKVTVRVEERIAFPVFGSRYFVYGDFGNS